MNKVFYLFWIFVIFFISKWASLRTEANMFEIMAIFLLFDISYGVYFKEK